MGDLEENLQKRLRFSFDIKNIDITDIILGHKPGVKSYSLP